MTRILPIELRSFDLVENRKEITDQDVFGCLEQICDRDRFNDESQEANSLGWTD